MQTIAFDPLSRPVPDEVDPILENFGASLMMLDQEEDNAY